MEKLFENILNESNVVIASWRRETAERLIKEANKIDPSYSFVEYDIGPKKEIKYKIFKNDNEYVGTFDVFTDDPYNSPYRYFFNHVNVKNLEFQGMNIDEFNKDFNEFIKLDKRVGHKTLNEGKFKDKVIPTLIGIGATAGIAAPLTGLAIHQNKSFDRLVDSLGLELSDKANQPDGASCFVNAIKDFKYDGKISKEYGMDIDGLCDYLYDYSNKHFSVTGDGLDISYEDCGDYYLISYEGEYIISIGNPNFRSKKSCHAEDSFKISKDYFGTQFILDEATVAQAKRFATRKHGERGQIRKATGAPYIVHPEGVAKIVKDFGGDDEQIQAAWLHDTMEDTGTWEEDLREKFGDRVADLVSELTNDDFAIRSIGKEDYMSNKLVNLSDDALLIKLSDFLYNIKDHCPMKTLERMKKNLEVLNFSGRKLDDKCDKLLIDCLEAIDEEM